jgi:hypothetical protein
MIDQKIRVLSEALARGMNRRSFVQRASGAVASGIAALMLGPALANRTDTASAGPLVPAAPQCAPPGPYCNTDGVNLPTGCRGGGCFEHKSGGTVYQCVVVYNWYTTGCWTSAQGGGYWTCCDCNCGGGGFCGCASYNPGSQVNPL